MQGRIEANNRAPVDVIADTAWPSGELSWPRGLSGSEGSTWPAALAASLDVSGLPSCDDIDALLKSAVELARGSIGLERVAFYLRQPCAGRLLLRGTWGTGARGETTDEHELSHELSAQDGKTLARLRLSGACALYRPRARWYVFEAGEARVLGEGWVMVTPLVSGQDLIGVMYNDAALSRSAIDPRKQVAAAVLAAFVGTQYAARSGQVVWEPLGTPRLSPLVERVRQALDQDLAVSGKQLAHRFGVSAGHLARVFKREMRVSLVEYRNRRRFARFAEVLAQSRRSSMKQAAFDAGFGSYAQFNRIHKRVVAEGWTRPNGGGPAAPPSLPSRLAHAGALAAVSLTNVSGRWGRRELDENAR